MATSDAIPDAFYFPQLARVSYPDVYSWRYLGLLKQNIKNFFLRSKMKKNDWLEELIKDEIDGFVSFDNNHLMYRLYNQVQDVYKGEGLQKPFTMIYAQTILNYYYRDQEYLDKVFFTSPGYPVSNYNFKYPGDHIGIQGIYNVFQYLLSQDPEFSDLIHTDKMYVPMSVIRTITDEMVFRVRTKQREYYNIGKEVTLIDLKIHL
jgi:hypothetical protein